MSSIDSAASALAIMLTHHDINHSISNEDSAYTGNIISIANGDRDQRRPTAAAGKAGVQLHFFERWRTNQRRGKQNARLVAVVFVVIGILIASGPFIVSKFQQGSVVSFKQSASEPVTGKPDDGSGGLGPTPTFYPSMSSISADVDSSTPPIKSEITATIQSVAPTHSPSRNPTAFPTSRELTHSPSNVPSSDPTVGPTTSRPTFHPSMHPTFQPTSSPTTKEPTHSPSSYPTTSNPTTSPSMHPTTTKPSYHPTFKPTHSPSSNPTSSPTTKEPTLRPSNQPTTGQPTGNPTTSQPTASPSMQPITANPSSHPTFVPTISPTKDPNSCPSPACLLNALLSWLVSNSSSSPSNPTVSSTTSRPTFRPSMHPTVASPSSHSSAFSTLKPNSMFTLKPTPSEFVNNDGILTANPTMSTSSLRPLPSHPSVDLTLETVSPNSSSFASNSPSSSDKTNAQTKPIKGDFATGEPTASEFASSEIFATNATTSKSRVFSSQVLITFKGISQLMDSDASRILEDTTLSFLNEQFLEWILVNEVTLSSQSVVQSSEPIRALSISTEKTLPQTGINSAKSMLRSLAATLPPPSLLVTLGVEGMITNWTAFSAGEDVRASGDSLSTLLSQSISSNSEEFIDRLADESDFFPSVTPRGTTSSLLTDSVTSSEESQGRTIFFIFGVVVAVGAMAGAFYMKRKRPRQCVVCDDELSRDAQIGGVSIIGYECEDGVEVCSVSAKSTSTMTKNSVIDEEEAEVERSSLSACTPRKRTTSIPKSVENQNRLNDGDEAKHSVPNNISHVNKSADDALLGINRHSVEEKSPSFKQHEVNSSMVSAAAEMATKLKSSALRQVQSGGDCQSGEESRSQSSDDESCQREVEASQSSEHDEMNSLCDEQDHMESPMTTACAPTGDIYSPPANQESMTRRESKSKSYGKRRKEHEPMEYSAYEVVLQRH